MNVTPTHLCATGEAEFPAVGSRLPVRVVGGIPGELAEVRLLHRGGNFVHTAWVSAAEPSADRVEVACEHVARCGGCTWLHITPTRQHLERSSRVQGILAAAGVLIEVEARQAPENTGRHVLKLVATDLDSGPNTFGGGVRFGAYRPRSHDIERIPGCLALTRRLKALTDLPPLRLPPGLARHLIARTSSLDGRVLATLVVRDDHRALRDIEPVLRRAGVDGLSLHRNDRPGDGILDPAGTTLPLWGIHGLRESVGEGVTVDIGPTDFFQTNPAVGRQIWAELPAPQHTVVDLYAGVGAVAFALWARAKKAGAGLKILGVEASTTAVAHARGSAERLGAEAQFVAAEAGSALPEGYQGATVVLNPPRKGTTEAVRAQTAALNPERIVYISCHPEPLARDLAEWQQRGWKLASVRTYDMFPGTPHVETVAVLQPG